MGAVLRIGPAVIPVDRLLVIGAMVVFLVAGSVAFRNRRPPRGWDLVTLATALAVARLVYVILHWSAFAEEPLTILAVWSGGLSAPAFFAAGVSTLLILFRRRPTLLPRLGLVVAAATLSWLVPTLAVGPGARYGELPELAVERLDGTEISVAELSGEALVVNLWATWCPPCRRELPMLVAEAERRSDVRFLLVSQGESTETVRSYLDQEELSSDHIYVDPTSRLGAALDVQALPSTAFFDRQGSLADAVVGEISRARLREGIERSSP